MIFIIKGFRTIVFIFIVISTTFWLVCPPAFFRCLSNSGTYTELQTMSFIESMGVACSDSISHNWAQVLSIPVLLLACSQHWISNLQMIVSLEAKGTNTYNRYAMCRTHSVTIIGIGSFICTQSNGSKYCYVIPIVQFQHTVKGFQVLQFDVNNSVQHPSFICTQLNGFK